MEVTITQRFEELWNNFVTSFKGSLLGESRKQTLTYPLAKLLLQDAILTWNEDYSINGAWLRQLTKDEPKKAAIVKEILNDDMHLTETDVKQSDDTLVRYGIPIGSGIAGLAISNALSASALVQAASTIGPMAIAIALCHSHIKSKKATTVSLMVDDYVEQLDKYKQAIIATLMAE